MTSTNNDIPGAISDSIRCVLTLNVDRVKANH